MKYHSLAGISNERAKVYDRYCRACGVVFEHDAISGEHTAGLQH
jgi:hypothetical protein